MLSGGRRASVCGLQLLLVSSCSVRRSKALQLIKPVEDDVQLRCLTRAGPDHHEPPVGGHVVAAMGRSKSVVFFKKKGWFS